MYISVYFVPENTPVILRIVTALEVDLQVFHKDVQTFTSSRRAVDSLKHRSHLARFDRLEDLNDGLKMCFLYIYCCQYGLTILSSPYTMFSIYTSWRGAFTGPIKGRN